jgi:hypothetical protein
MKTVRVALTPPALCLQSVTGSWMETDQVGYIGGKRGHLKEYLSWDTHRLNSDKLTKWKDLLILASRRNISE